MTIGERIKYSRKNASLTQQRLADIAGLKQNTIATYETDRVSPSDRSLADIAKACRVDEHWLRTGDGSPEPELSEYEEIMEFVSVALADKSETIQQKFLLAFARLDAEGWKAVADLAEKLHQNGL